MQQENYYDMEEGPPGDDDLTWAGVEDRTSGNSRRQAQQPTGAPRLPPPPTWTLAPTHQHGVVDSRLRFDLVLPALPEEVIEQIRGVLRAVEHLDRPYMDLKARGSCGCSPPSQWTRASSSSSAGNSATGGPSSSWRPCWPYSPR